VKARALLLDLDDTLLDPAGARDAVARACDLIAVDHPALDAARLLDANTAVWRDYWPQVEQHWPLGALTGAAVSLEAWRRTLHACGVGDGALALRAADTHWRLTRAAYRLHDDALALLDAVDGRLPLALVTNGASDTQREKLVALGIERRFAAVVISGEAGVAKPDPSIFRRALDRLGVPPAAAWHVGDSLASDVAGARAAGVTAVWINRRATPLAGDGPTPHHHLRSLAELAPLLAPGA
jgi:putative hydrolase of the HAD superfamily